MNIEKVSQLAGVSKSTVSRYLNNGSVSQRTKEKIEKIIKTHNYEPNRFAQSLKAKRTNMLGVIVPRVDSFAANETFKGIDKVLHDSGLQSIIYYTNQDINREMEGLKALFNQRVDGIILMATHMTAEHMSIINSVDIPVVIVGQFSEGVHCIIHDDYGAGRKMAEYIARYFKDDLLYLGVSDTDEAVGIKRRDGVLDYFDTLGITCKTAETSFNYSEAFDDIGVIFEASVPEVMICATDNIALAALKHAIERGISVPDELSITGFGGYNTTNIVTPTLTTVRFGYFEAGEKAAESILKLIDGERISMIQHVGNELIINESVDKK